MSVDLEQYRQAEAAECGLVSLAIVSALFGAPVSLSELRRTHPVSPRGLTLKQVIDIGGAIQLSGRAVRCDLKELPKLSTPAILHWGLNHFVVLQGLKGARAVIVDPATGRRTVDERELSAKFTGVAVEFSPTPLFEKRPAISPLKVSSLIQFTPKLKAGLTQVLILSLLLQAYVVISPFYMQLAIDEAAMKGDLDLLLTLALGFGIFATFNAVAEGFRSVALQAVSSLVSWQMTRRLFHQMVRLPLPWFQRRKLADVLTRFDSLNPIKDAISNGFIGGLIDGLLGVSTFVMMVIFAPVLGVMALLQFLLLLTIKLISVPVAMRYGIRALSASISEQGKRIETLRAIQTIKLMAGEADRESDWSNKLADTLKARQENALIGTVFAGARSLIDALFLVGSIYLGARNIIAGHMTVGVFYAFVSYRAQFLSRSENLLDQMVSWKLTDMHTHRLADIALQPREPGIEKLTAADEEIVGKVELRGVGFRYAPQDPAIFSNLNLTIEPGEFVAIVGPSGTGKSSLLKVMCGLYPASTGSVFFDDIPLEHWGPRAVRRSLGVVMQDDELLSGSIADNVAFFDESLDIARVRTCLDIAAMTKDIAAMPMKESTLVGDMGASLSGGQKQRILIARALYKQPRIMVLDEATSHLDVQTEHAIGNAIQALNITRIIVAHRPETIASADRVVVIDGGRIVRDVRKQSVPVEHAHG